MNELLWGIDLGGTKIELAGLNSQDHKVIFRKRLPTESSLGYDHIISQIERLIIAAEDKLGVQIQKIGMGTPGILDPEKLVIKNSNTVCLNGQALKADLESKLNRTFIMANDANCFALAEAKMGVVKDHITEPKLVFGIIMGTGVGGGLILNNQAHIGLHGIGGEWGHNFLDASGGTCYCGKIGCVETIISGPALERFYFSQTQQSKSLSSILKDTETDIAAQLTKDRLIQFFGIAVSTLINVLDPDAIVIGGGLSNVDDLYTAGKEAALSHVFNDEIKTLILKPKLGDSAGVFGAALLSQ